MRKREIHSVAHWAMMFILLMFPILMVGISTFGKDETVVDFAYKYESNNVTSSDDLLVGNIYRLTFDEQPTDASTYKEICWSSAVYNITNFNNTYTFESETNNNYYRVRYNNTLLLFSSSTYASLISVEWSNVSFPYTFDFVLYDKQNISTTSETYQVSKTDFNVVTSYDVTQRSYKYEVNSWLNEFLDLPINAWYKSLMNVVGVGFTSSTVMNVIYVMPVYILWVFIFDVIVDCFLVIIKLPHKLLNRLSGGENE